MIFGKKKKKFDYDDDCGLCWVVGAILAVLFGTLVHFIRKDIKEEERLNAITPVIYTIPRGRVVRLNQCRSSKHSYDCTITMSDGKTWRTDITDWPDEMLTPGTVLHWEIWTQDYRQKQLTCNKKWCFRTNRAEKGDDDYSEVFAKGN